MSLAVTLAVEDVISEAVARKLIDIANPVLVVEQVIGNKGFGFLKTKVPVLNGAAHNGVVSIVIADLDNEICPTKLKNDWLRRDPHPNLLFRVAIKEIEAWLLADHEGFSEFFGVPQGRIPQIADDISDPKQMVVNLVRGSRRSGLRRAMVPPQGAHSSVGPEYNSFMLEFARSGWSLMRARGRSRSLNGAFLALQRFPPQGH